MAGILDIARRVVYQDSLSAEGLDCLGFCMKQLRAQSYAWARRGNERKALNPFPEVMKQPLRRGGGKLQRDSAYRCMMKAPTVFFEKAQKLPPGRQFVQISATCIQCRKVLLLAYAQQVVRGIDGQLLILELPLRRKSGQAMTHKLVQHIVYVPYQQCLPFFLHTPFVSQSL